MLLSHHQIKGLLPHRHPLLLVDAITAMEPWTSIVGLKAVTATETCYAHLDDAAPASAYAYPPSLLIESFGQTGGVLIGAKRESGRDDRVVLFATMSRVEFTGVDVFPGDTMEHRVALRKDASEFAILGGEVWVRDRKIASVDDIIVAYRPQAGVAQARGA